MEEKKEFNKTDYRFSYTLNINDGTNEDMTICKRDFSIHNFDEESLRSIELKECIDDVVTMIDMDLKSKSRVHTWYNYDENYKEGEFNIPIPENQTVSLKFTFFDGETPIISKSWSGDEYPYQVRNSIDLTNKKFKYESINIQALDFQRQVAQKASVDKSDLTISIRNLICSVCASFPKQNNRKVIYKNYLPELGYETMAVRKGEYIPVKSRLQPTSIQMDGRSDSAIYDVYTNEIKFGDVTYDLLMKPKVKAEVDRVLTQSEIREKLKSGK